MKRLSTFTVAISLWTALWACGPFVITPRDFVVYKLGTSPDVERSTSSRDTASWREWCHLAGGAVTLADVARTIAHGDAHNAFAQWLATNSEAREYMALARQCQMTREFMQDAWYYPDTESDSLLSIEEIEQRALAHNASEMQGRYVLLAVRAMVTQHKYEQCLDYWRSVDSQVTCAAVRHLIEPYLLGCRCHMGEYAATMPRFVELGDVESAQYCAAKLNVDVLSCAYANPELPFFRSLLNDYLCRLDVDTKWYGAENPMNAHLRDEILARRDICLQVATRRPANEAMWLYAAAAMSDACNDAPTAIALCRRALTARGHRELDDKIRVLKFYVQARSMRPGRAYDAVVQQGVSMLARLTERDIAQFSSWMRGENETLDEISIIDKELVYYSYHEEANYYWHNMLRRIVVGEVVPRMIEAGMTTRALMLCNMAENHLNRLMAADSLMQRYDNSTFIIADTLTLSAVERYRHRVNHPRSAYERWLVSRGYNNADYWNELLGTKSLRLMNYARAVTYFTRVSRSYQHTMNIWHYIEFDPMHYRWVDVDNRYDYKLRYATQMLKAQREAAAARDANVRADAMMRLATGWFNATGNDELEDQAPCWPLLYYGTGWLYGSRFGKYNETLCRRQAHMQEEYLERAYATFTDAEQAARWKYEWCDLRGVLTAYPSTHMAQYIATHCDELRDHYYSAKKR